MTPSDATSTEPRTVMTVLAELQAAIDAPRPDVPAEENWEAEQDEYRRELRNMHHRVERLKRELGELLADCALESGQLVPARITNTQGVEHDAVLLVIDSKPVVA